MYDNYEHDRCDGCGGYKPSLDYKCDCKEIDTDEQTIEKYLLSHGIGGHARDIIQEFINAHKIK